MHRDPLRKLLDAYREHHPDETDCVDRIRGLVDGHANCFERSCLPGHITASSWIVSHDHSQVLLTHHRKLGLWLQLGGHADGETKVLDVALREAREESGMQNFRVVKSNASELPFDVDVHEIPPHKNDPAHEHHDIRYLLVAEPGQPLVMSSESKDLRWFPVEEIPSIAADESIVRMHRKARALLTQS